MGPRDPYDPDGRTEIIEDERVPVRPTPPWWRERWWIWFLILLIAVAALIGFFFYMEAEEDEEAARTVVPAVVGLQEEEARARLEEAGLDAEVERRESSEPEGEVIDQDPEAGAQVAEGQAVRLVVSSGEEETETETETETVVETETVEEEPQPTEMPDVVGADFREAARTILDAGLLPTSYPVESSEPQGSVLAQNPDPGTELPEGSIVRMNVSLGPGGRAEGEIPDLTGPEAEEALRRCHDAGFTCRIVERAAPDEESEGEIIDQNPAAGVRAASLSQITLFLGR